MLEWRERGRNGGGKAITVKAASAFVPVTPKPLKRLDLNGFSLRLAPKTRTYEAGAPWRPRQMHKADRRAAGAAFVPAVKTLTCEHVFRDKHPPTPEKYASYAAHRRNPDVTRQG